MPSAETLLHRDHELRALDGVMRQLAAGRSSLVIVEGARGLGKTALLDAAVERRPEGVALRRARCHESERDLELGVAGQLLGRLPGGDVRQLYQALGTDGGPLVVAVDDLEVADEPSREFVRYLARHRDGMPVALLLTAAGDTAFPASAGATVLRLGPLCETCVAELAASRFGSPLDPELAAACHVLSQGNPLILDELVDRLRGAGVSPGAPDMDVVLDLGAATLADTALAWLHGRDPASVELLTNLALLGEGFDLDAAAMLSGHGQLIAAHARTELRRAGLLAEDGPDRCRDELIRTAILSRLDPSRRLHLHADAARLLLRLGAPARQVADHLMSVGPSDEEWTVPVLRGAAHDAAADAAWETAARYLRQALAAASDPEQIAALTAELGAVELHHDVAAAARYGATVAAGGPDRGGALLPFASPVLALNASVSFGEALAGPLAREPLLRLGAQALLTGHRTRRAMRAVTAGGPDDATREFVGALAAATAATGRRRTATLRLARRAGTGIAAATALSWAEAFDEALAAVGAAVEVARSRRHPGERALALLVRADIAYRIGRLAASLRDARQAVQLARQVSAAGLAAAASALAARVLLERGEVPAASDLLDRATPPATLHPLLHAQVLDVRGLVALAAGRADEAIELFLECGHRLSSRGIANPAAVPWRMHAGLAYVAAGELPAAQTIAADGIVLARTWGAAGTLGASLAASSASSEGDERVAKLDEAVALLDDAGRPLDLAQALCRLSAATDAPEPARRALDLARDCGAITLVQQLQSGATPAAVRVPAVGPTAPARLTASERRVIELVRQGLSNHAVAEALCLSKRTVDTHLGRVYRKLGIRGRMELAAALDAQPE